MPVTDRREPGVYVTIEDKSYVAPTIEIGRIGYIVILCDHGPHNRIVTITSQKQFHSLFGKPDYRRTSQTHYLADKFMQYSGKCLICRVVPEDSYWSNMGIEENNTSETVQNNYSFENASKTVIPENDIAYNSFNVGEWIFSSDDTLSEALQIVSKDDQDGFKFILSDVYPGVTSNTTAQKFIPYKTLSLPSVDKDGDLPHTDSEIVYYFYANGAGQFYNRITIKGVRNIEMEKMYTNKDGVILYKYIFMDIAVYYNNEDGTETLIEGPWTVSLIRRTPENQVIRNLATGRILYIEDMINETSDFIRCKTALANEKLITSPDAEDRRLQVMLLFSQANPIATTNIAGGGINLQNGTDGTGLYDSFGNYALQPYSPLEGLVKQAYMGSLTSVDGSVEQMPEVTYPWYEPDKRSKFLIAV